MATTPKSFGVSILASARLAKRPITRLARFDEVRKRIPARER
jgi:hypothetical protein